MNKKIMILCFTAILLCGCSANETEKTTLITADLSTSSAEYDRDIYFDTSDIKYVGNHLQRIAIGYEFEYEEDDDPIFTYKKYESEDGEIFYFDEFGRFCYYRNTEDIFLNDISSGSKMKITDDEVKKLSEEIVSSCLEGNKECKATLNKTVGELRVSTLDETNPSIALIKFTEDGEVRSLSISHNTLTVDVDEEYFQKKFDAYIEDIKNSYKIVDYNYTVRYEQIDNKVYAMFTANFVEDDGCKFSEGVGFTKILDDVKE